MKNTLSKISTILILILLSVPVLLNQPVKAQEENTWTSLALMPTPRRELVIAAVNGKIYAIGGFYGTDRFSAALNVNEEYNPATNTWTNKTSMPTARWGSAFFVYENKIHIRKT